MSNRYQDADGRQLEAGDYVQFRSHADELFRIESLRFPADAVIENILPGGRLGTSTVDCKDLYRKADHLCDARPDWWYDAPFPVEPIPETVLHCGCHLHRRYLTPVLCGDHSQDEAGQR